MISKAKGAWARAVRFFSEDRHDFSRIVGLQATQLVAEAAKQGKLDPETKAALLDAIRYRLDELPSELSDETVKAALRKGDISALTLLASGTSLAGIAIAVELAGFSAYIVAAQVSAIIPLLGGKAAVSGLFVLSNPLFIVPALLGGSALANRV